MQHLLTSTGVFEVRGGRGVALSRVRLHPPVVQILNTQLFFIVLFAVFTSKELSPGLVRVVLLPHGGLAFFKVDAPVLGVLPLCREELIMRLEAGLLL